MRFLNIAGLAFAAMLIIVSCSADKKPGAAKTTPAQKSPAALKAEKLAALRAEWLQEFEEPVDLQEPKEANIVIAADSGSMEAVMWHLQNGTPVGQPERYGYTALHRAAARANNEMVKYLIAKGADPNQLNDDGFIALHNAAMSGDSMTVELLMQAGSVIYSRDNNEMTPLHLAAMKDNFSAAKALIRNGANVEDSTSTRWTPRRVARQYEHMAMDSFLTVMGATK